jgi:hypothetical protein
VDSSAGGAIAVIEGCGRATEPVTASATLIDEWWASPARSMPTGLTLLPGVKALPTNAPTNVSAAVLGRNGPSLPALGSSIRRIDDFWMLAGGLGERIGLNAILCWMTRT